jgi:hypothetical protein
MRWIVFVMCAASAALVPVRLLSAGRPIANSKTVLVSVVAGTSGPVRDLAPSDIKMDEGRRAVEVVGVDPANGPMSISLLLDTTYPAGRIPPTADLRRAVTTFVSTVTAAAPDAEFAVYSVSNAAIPLCDFTSDRPRIAGAIANLAMGAQSASPILEGIVEASHTLERKPAPRRAVVAVTFASAEAAGEDPSYVAAELLKSGATLWVVSVSGVADAPNVAREEVWRTVPASSGGMNLHVLQSSGLEEQLKTVANTLTSQYTVTFARKNDSAVQQLSGATTKGAKILFSHWVR